MSLAKLALCATTAVLGLAAYGQDPRAAMEQSLEKQRASLERQRAAVRGQVPKSQPMQNSFFTVAWTEPLPPIVLAPQCDPVPEEQIGPLVEELAKREGLTPDLLRAVIEKESSYLPCAVSASGAEGLMQLMPETAAELGVGDPFDTRENVDAGARLLKQLLDRYDGNLRLALAAYNAGPARVDAVRGLPLIPETMNYVSSILSILAPPAPAGIMSGVPPIGFPALPASNDSLK